ncbi:MAG: hypothetical protein DHS20C12_20780 [Pseudohongiella sp.]|nr:MAG: hypothetical protein DHS20C12_20780 [Pseudohongiella sp.]
MSSNTPTRRPALASVFALSLLLIGIPYWLLPYSQIALPNSLFGPGFLAVPILAVLARALLKCDFDEVSLAIGAAYPGAVLLRILVDTVISSTSHNLWPFEIIIASIAGLVVGTAASGLGGIVRRMTEKSEN